MIDNSTSLRDFLFRGLMLESEAERFQSAGIQIGASASNSDQHLLAEALAPFSVSRRNNALEMARLYALLYVYSRLEPRNWPLIVEILIAGYPNTIFVVLILWNLIITLPSKTGKFP